MAKIGILTYHFVLNYGAVLQAFALQEYLKKRGHQVELIDYRPSHLEKGGRFYFPKNIKLLKMNLIKVYIKLRSFFYLFSKQTRLKNKKFQDFQNGHLNLSKKTIKQFKCRTESFLDYDIFICGSDQIWNSSNHSGIDRAYFFSFLPENCFTVSYAASFGRSFIEEKYRNEVAELLKPFNLISVRELSGVKMVKELSGKEAQCVLDPTLLLGEGLLDLVDFKKPNEDFVFSYALRSKDTVNLTNDYISKKLNLNLISDKSLKAKKYALSPLEWVSHIKGSSFVVTNSYHGTLFSLIFKKPFIFVALSGAKSSYNERALSLLGELGLMSRVLKSFNETRIDAIIELEINWVEVSAKLSDKRKNSEEFLEAALRYDG